MTEKFYAKKIVKEYGKKESLKICDDMIVGNLFKAREYWLKVKRLIKNN